MSPGMSKCRDSQVRMCLKWREVRSGDGGAHATVSEGVDTSPCARVSHPAGAVQGRAERVTWFLPEECSPRGVAGDGEGTWA